MSDVLVMNEHVVFWLGFAAGFIAAWFVVSLYLLVRELRPRDRRELSCRGKLWEDDNRRRP